ncbi:MAG: biotin--[acetyl-CoA-carboxylase] ligase [Peptostreptococcaceae bacterium]|nr:biotin--[acetyl-CoA-carboxylase] ligase [Peptostreptococcaceae bacterium]
MSVKETVLKVLEANKGSVVSGQIIAAEAGASRAAVWKAIAQLREEGYSINASTKKGYTLSSLSDLLSAEGIHSFCNKIPKDKIYCFKTINSTNAKAKQLAVQGGIDMALIVSEEQTNGRGRMGRIFFSPNASGIYMSLLIKPDFDISKSILATTAASVAVCRAIDSVLNINCRIKWVNDIFLADRKIGGILTEAITDFESGQVEYIVIGIGINYWAPKVPFPEDIKDTAGSLLNESSSNSMGNTTNLSNIFPKSRNELVGEISSELISLLNSLNNIDFLEEYKSRSLILGHQVTFSTLKNGQIFSESGKAVDIDSDGSLVVLLEDGNKKTINSGEVTIRKQPE